MSFSQTPVQTGVNGSNNATSVAVTLGASPTEGNLLVVSCYGKAAADLALTGFSLVESQYGAGGDRQTAWYKVALASESSTITVTCASAGDMALAVAEYPAPTGGWNGLDVSAIGGSANSTVTSQAVGPTGTPVDADEIVFACFGMNDNTLAGAAITTGWTVDASITGGGGIDASAWLGSKIISSAVAQTATGTTTGLAEKMAGIVFSFREAAAGGPTYDETGRATTITSTTALTDAQGYAELLRAVAIAATINVSDVQDYVDLLMATAITATTNMSDAQGYADLLMATAIVSTITVTDVLGAGGPTYDETGKAITITATVNMTDLVRIFETLLATTVTSTTAMTDAQNYVDSLATVGTVTVSMTDLLSFYELLLATAGTTTVGMTDVQNYVEQLTTTAASTLSVSDVQNYVDALATAIVSFLTVRDIYTPVAGDPVIPSKSLQRRGRTSDQGIRTADRLARS